MSALARRLLPGVLRLSGMRPLARGVSSSTDVPKPLEDYTSDGVPVAPQAPNAPTVWSTSQRPRPVGTTGPRFEQANMELQPQPLSAMAMIADEPIRIVHGRKAVCDGGMHSCYIERIIVLNISAAGSGPLGHPKIFINLVCVRLSACKHCD